MNRECVLTLWWSQSSRSQPLHWGETRALEMTAAGRNLMLEHQRVGCGDVKP